MAPKLVCGPVVEHHFYTKIIVFHYQQDSLMVTDPVTLKVMLKVTIAPPIN